MDQVPAKNSLVLYKQHPARVLSVTDKLEIELDQGKIQRVRPKDVLLLHGGPLSSLAELTPQAGELQEAWQLLAGSETSLEELSELAFGQYTPATAWATWQQVMESLGWADNHRELNAVHQDPGYGKSGETETPTQPGAGTGDG